MLKDLVDYFKLDEINIDNWTFKLYYKAGATTSVLLVRHSTCTCYKFSSFASMAWPGACCA